MKIENALKKIEKAGGSIEKLHGNHFHCSFSSTDYLVEFFEQDGSAMCFSARHKNDKSDSQSDYSAGVFCNNLAQAMQLALR